GQPRLAADGGGDHLRRGRRMVRPRAPAGGGRLRARHARPDPGRVPVRAPRPRRPRPVRARVDPRPDRVAGPPPPPPPRGRAPPPLPAGPSTPPRRRPPAPPCRSAGPRRLVDGAATRKETSMGGPRLAGKVAIVTGAGSRAEGIGNGRATAVLFAREGAR